MKRIVKNIALLLIVFGIGIGITLINANDKYEVYDEESKQIKKHIGAISMMLETEAGSGNYEMTTRSEWPTDGYTFNSTLSKCENGGEVYWDDSSKKVFMSANMSDKCYVYFDKVHTLASYVISLYTGTQGGNNIYYHDTNLENGAGDNSYRYAGASENVNNFVCFGSNESPCPTDNLYRIIGVFENYVKVIKATTIGDMFWDEDSTSWSNTWSTSSLNAYLNGTYLTNMGTLANKIETATWKVGGNTWANISVSTAKEVYKYEIIDTVVPTNSNDGKAEYSAKIGLMYVSDYMFAIPQEKWKLIAYNVNDSTKDYRAATSSNWLYSGKNEYTISRSSNNTDDVFVIYSSGEVYSYIVNCGSGELLPCKAYKKAVRPSFYLIPSVIYKSGSGTQNDPIIIAD